MTVTSRRSAADVFEFLICFVNCYELKKRRFSLIICFSRQWKLVGFECFFECFF